MKAAECTVGRVVYIYSSGHLSWSKATIVRKAGPRHVKVKRAGDGAEVVVSISRLREGLR